MGDEVEVKEEQKETTGTLEDFAPVEEVRIAIHGKNKNVTAHMIFEPMDKATLRRFRQIYNGPPGSRRGDPDKAEELLFRRKFLRVEGMSLPEHDYPDEKTFFLKHPQAQLITDAALNAYIASSTADADDIKE